MPSDSSIVNDPPLARFAVARRLGTLSLSFAIFSLRLARYRFSMTVCDRFFGPAPFMSGGESSPMPVESSLADFLFRVVEISVARGCNCWSGKYDDDQDASGAVPGFLFDCNDENVLDFLGIDESRRDESKPGFEAASFTDCEWFGDATLDP